MASPMTGKHTAKPRPYLFCLSPPRLHHPPSPDSWAEDVYANALHWSPHHILLQWNATPLGVVSLCLSIEGGNIRPLRLSSCRLPTSHMGEGHVLLLLFLDLGWGEKEPAGFPIDHLKGGHCRGQLSPYLLPRAVFAVRCHTLPS
ncbi:hypothetical protein AAFF_G00176820 [Aldrovandia affinis]|uniref:Uncharacterized protein n=1 Tax=Aldrovandia affinis TaxID=143900 RepID=A0AAD7RL00_9TELE|nr:hypothetical protein AAFF_G00176820 [Aldrovandia affinis]